MAIEIGLQGHSETLVEQEDTAKSVGSGDLLVYATPCMAALMEGAACESIAPYLAEGETSVGVSLQLFHTAATPVGMEVRAESIVTAVDGKKITFTVTAYDEAGEIGHAQHERVIVKAERCLEKTYDKL